MLESSGTRRVIAGSRNINGKRYAFEAEAVACVSGQGVANADPDAAAAVLDRVQEMLHKSLAGFAREGAHAPSSKLQENLTGVEPGNQDYYGLIDCQIGDQRGTDLPSYLQDLAGTLERQMDCTAKVRERLFFVVTGQLIEADIENVVPVLDTKTDPHLPANALDFMLMVDVYHEFSPPEEMLAAIRKSLKPEGRIALAEFRAEDPEVPIKLLHKISKQQIFEEFCASCFNLVGQFDGLPWQHLMLFSRYTTALG